MGDVVRIKDFCGNPNFDGPFDIDASVSVTTNMGLVVGDTWMSLAPTQPQKHPFWYVVEMKTLFHWIEGRGWCPAIERDLVPYRRD